MRDKILNSIIVILVAIIIGVLIYYVVFNKTINNVKLDSFELNKDNMELIVGGREKLEVTIKPDNYKNRELIWSSVDPSVATVDDYGNVMALSEGSTVINVTLRDEGLKEVCVVKVVKPTPTPTITPSPKPTVTITPSPTTTPTIKPTVSPTPTPVPKYTINYYSNGGNGRIDSQTCTWNETCTIKTNTYTRNGYTSNGWTTKSNGEDDNYNWTNWSGIWKYSNGEYGIKDNTLNLYSRWIDNATRKVITRDYVVPSGYSITDKVYDSNTLKYKVIKKNNANRYYALIWVKDAHNQLNCGNSNYTYQTKPNHFNNEIKGLGYEKKGIIGTNGGFAINGRDNIPVLVTKGVYQVNNNYKTTYNGRYSVYGTLSVNYSNKLIHKIVTDPNEADAWLKSNGARNAWGVTDFTTSANQNTSVEGSDTRTNICQIDEYNFVLAVGNISKVHQELHNMFGCISVANLDGGGSTGMYYKTNTMNSIGTIYQYKRPNESTYRQNVDILYFNE